MLEDITERGLFSLAELHHLRLEAMQLFEQCLTQGDASAMIAFIEAQLTYQPPRLQLLRDLADDLQQRLLSLREYHFDVRDRVVRTFRENYGVDLTPLTPSDALDHYHQLITDAVLSFAQENGATFGSDTTLLRKMVEASIQMAAQLYHDILLTTQLHQLVLDWLEGMYATVARQHWSTSPPSDQGDICH